MGVCGGVLMVSTLTHLIEQVGTESLGDNLLMAGTVGLFESLLDGAVNELENPLWTVQRVAFIKQSLEERLAMIRKIKANEENLKGEAA